MLITNWPIFLLRINSELKKEALTLLSNFTPIFEVGVVLRRDVARFALFLRRRWGTRTLAKSARIETPSPFNHNNALHRSIHSHQRHRRLNGCELQVADPRMDSRGA
jgi:hypothetical protein